MKFDKCYQIIIEQNSLLIPRRIEDRQKHYIRILLLKVQEYIKDPKKHGDLILANYPLPELPSELKYVAGNLFISYSKIRTLPPGIVIEGDLIAYDSDLEIITKDCIIKGDISVSSSKIKKLPENQKKYKALDLNKTLIEVLPDNLSVTDLYLRGCKQLKSLPRGLKVKRTLNLHGTNIKELPNDIIVRGIIYLSATPLRKKYTREQIKTMCPGITGEIFLNEFS